ncbi:protein [Lentinula edodes]|uniref:Protein n=1 Tax=Lentinula edodes TaxID=5353 RepID=A0A1Q3EK61_LENED|nr:protein [Lentinula edodes]
MRYAATHLIFQVLHLNGVLARPDLNNSTAPYLFNDLYSLLIHWPNTFHPNGHTIIPGVIEPYTLLYHARKDAQIPPPSPEWLAFDPEMSYAVMATKIPGPTYMYTYRTTKLVKVLYFNGMSAAWGEGWLDTQYSVLTGKGKTNGSRNNEVSLWDDYGRAKGLCQWGKQRDIEGIVRMNAGFEIIWCDFESSSLKLVSSLNITPPGTPEARRSFPFPSNVDLNKLPVDELPLQPPRGPGRGPGRGRRPGGGHGPWGFDMAPLARTGNLEWLRAASRYHSTVQPHLSLSYHQMVSFYHPRYRSLTTTFDWQAAAMDIVTFWADRIAQIQNLLEAVNSTSNLTHIVTTVQQLSYSPLDPFIAYGEALNASGHEIVFNVRSSPMIVRGTITPNTTALERCTYSATEFLTEPELQILMTNSEHILKTSMETILERICNDFGILFAESTDLTDSFVIWIAYVQCRYGLLHGAVVHLEGPAEIQTSIFCNRLVGD